MVSLCPMKSKSTSKIVSSPRGVTYSGTFHQWFSKGASASRVLPTICVHMWIVSHVFSHSAKGRGGHSVEIKFHLVHETPAPILARLEGLHNRVMAGVKVFGRVLVLG